MNRLEKKCLIASTGTHLLLALILFVGPGFLNPGKPSETLPVIDFVPSRLVDAAVTGGGNPNARPPQAAPVQPPQQTPAPPAPKPEPRIEPKVQEKAPELPKPVVKDDKPDPDAVEPAPKKRQIQVNTTRVVRKPDTKPTSTSRSQATEAQAEERRLADARRDAANRLIRAAQNVRTGAAGATAVEDFGPGGGGPAYASFKAWVQKVYEEAWEAPEDASSDVATGKATVTIASDGTIINARLAQGSGDAAVDRSIVRTLERVKTIGYPFPEGAKEKQRTYIINFNLKAKRLIG
jgi:colicin import membrane protein